MKSMIDELWYGNVSPMDDTRNNTEEMKELMSYIARHQEELVATLTDEQKAIFEKFDDCWSEYSSKAEKAMFSYAFRLGARVTMEVQKDT
ncbi:MAG: hypothetical protein IJD42_07180 [Clostridia bacterium]|nr:hypothetical protein [Clostridia bacterium]